MNHLILWLFYISGGVLSMWKRAHLAAKSDYTPWQSLREYATAHGPQLAINFLLSTALFWTWWNDPTILAKLLGVIGVQTDSALPLNPFLAAIYGVFSDVVMDFITAKIALKFQKPE